MRIAETKIWYAIKPYVPSALWDHFLTLLYWARSRKYKGEKYQCPICKMRLERLAGNSCPRCNGGSRHRAVWLYLHRKTDLFTRPNIKLLHFAPEYCLHRRIRAHKNIQYLSGDLYSTRAMQKIDIHTIPYPENHFDVCMSLDVLMHVDDDIQAIKELVRIQDPKGWSIHLVSIDKSLEKTVRTKDLNELDRLEVFGHFDYKRNYGKDYPDILQRQGFQVQTIEVDTYTTKEERERYRIPEDFKIYLCTAAVSFSREADYGQLGHQSR